MTTDEQTEWNYRFDERLGILCGPLKPTEEQKQMARMEASAAIERLQDANQPQMSFPLNVSGE